MNKNIIEKDKIFETKRGILFNSNCEDIFDEIEEGSIDLIFTDPPYNISTNNKLTKVGSKVVSNKTAWGNDFKDQWPSFDDYLDWLLPLIGKMSTLLSEKGSMILFLDRKFTGFFVYYIEKHFNLIFRNKIYFEKMNPLPHVRKNNYRSCIEEAIWFSKSKKYVLNFKSQKEMKQVFSGNIGKKVTKHPTEKYEWMILPIIERHSNPGSLILDPFAGSGTIPVISERLKREWIAIEKKKVFFEMIEKRLSYEIQYSLEFK